MISLRIKWFFLICLCITVSVLVMPTFGVNIPFLKGKLELGLDLQGGASVLLEVDTDQYIREHLSSVSDDIISTIRDKEIPYNKVVIGSDDFSISIMSGNASLILDELKSNKGNAYNVEIYNENSVVITLTSNYIKSLTDKVIRDSIENIRMRIDETGNKEIVLQSQGMKRILLQVPGEYDLINLRDRLGRTGKLTFHFLDERIGDNMDGINRLTTKVLFDTENKPYPVLRKTILTGDMLIDASATFNRNGIPAVMFQFNSLGSKKFAQITKEKTGNRFAVILDDVVLTAPFIREPILGGKGEITGSFTLDSANELALLLRAGALPAPISILEERIVGATLGKDSIEFAKVAALIAIALVAVFMVIHYDVFGVYAAIAMSLNAFFILAIMSVMGAVLTLPGLAGMILTFGMAVDANVLIFERIREEYKSGNPPMKAINKGFNQAIVTILDSNITTLIGAIIMFIIGSGPIKGFAITLSIGILSSMFTAITITRLMIVTWMHTYRAQNIPL